MQLLIQNKIPKIQIKSINVKQIQEQIQIRSSTNTKTSIHIRIKKI